MGWNYLSIPKLQRCNRWSLGTDKKFHLTLYQACDYLSMLGLKFNHVSKSGPWWQTTSWTNYDPVQWHTHHYDDVTMSLMASQITSLTIVYSTVYSGADQRKLQSSASLAIVRGIHRDRWIPRTRASNAENVSIWWRLHDEPPSLNVLHIEAETNWPPFSRRHFQMDFLKGQCLNFY